MSIQQALEIALQHHQAGQLGEAEALYRQILAAEPHQADALHCLGVIAHQIGRNENAVDLIRQAIALKPGVPSFHSNLGSAYRALGQLDEATAAFRRAIVLQPDLPEAHSNLGNALRETGQLEEAIAACHQAIALRPNYPDAFYNLGNALMDSGRPDEAIAAYRQVVGPGFPKACCNLGVAFWKKGELDEAVAALRRAIALQPDFPEAYCNLGNALRDGGQRDEAIAACRHAIALRPNYQEAHSNLGNALLDSGQQEAAVAAFRHAIALKPDYPEAYGNLGVALYGYGQLDDAIAAYHKAIALEPELPRAYSNLGIALYDKGQLDESVAVCRQAIALRPGYPEAHFNLSLALLLQGNLLEGWEEHEWRWQCKEAEPHRRGFTQPHWDGSHLEGRTILLHTEQGFGDALQFIRYLPQVRDRGGHVVIECQRELQRLFQTIAPDLTVVAKGQGLPDFDVHCSLVSLPRLFATDLGSIPQNVPYVQAGAGMWAERLAGSASLYKVGLVWAGNPAHKNDRSRSLTLASLATLAEIPGVQFFSLQKGERAAEARTPPPGMKLIDVTEELADFADTAVLIAALDLVIAVDTAAVHLAGAMGKPVWTMLPFAPDWRWLVGRADSPWYPTVRLFRQSSMGDWGSVIASVREQLQSLVRSGRKQSDHSEGI